MHTLNSMEGNPKYIIDCYISSFKKNIEHSLNNELFLTTFPIPFECIKPNDYYYLQKSVHISRNMIDKQIQTTLINDLIKELIPTIEAIDMGKDSRVFIVPPNAYCTHYLEEEHKEKLKRNGITNVYLISFKPKGKFIGDSAICFDEFLKKFLDIDTIDYYEETLKEAIEWAYKKTGLTTSFVLTPENLSTFKRKLINDLSNPENYRNDSVKNIEVINDNDYQIMDSKFIADGYYKYLCDDSDIAKCFITSEYLFSITKEYVAFDYASIVLGYYKCVELIVNKCVDVLSQKEVKYMLCNKKHIKTNCPKGKDCKLFDTCDNTLVLNKCSVIINKTNHKNVNLELMYKLIQICCAPNHILISKDGVDIVYSALDDFRENCRNGYVHSDVMIDRDEAANVRKKAWICIYYLLGGFDYADKFIKDVDKIDFTYNVVYEMFENIPRSVNKFIVNDNGKEMYLMREREKPTKVVDSNGFITTSLEFYIIDNSDEFNKIYDVETYERKPELKKYYISKDHIPNKIESYSKLKSELVFVKSH